MTGPAHPLVHCFSRSCSFFSLVLRGGPAPPSPPAARLWPSYITPALPQAFSVLSSPRSSTSSPRDPPHGSSPRGPPQGRRQCGAVTPCGRPSVKPHPRTSHRAGLPLCFLGLSPRASGTRPPGTLSLSQHLPLPAARPSVSRWKRRPQSPAQMLSLVALGDPELVFGGAGGGASANELMSVPPTNDE